MKENTVLTELDQSGVLTVTINRPETKNAFDTPTQRRMSEAFYDAARDPGVRAVVMRGSGSAFSSGGDVRALGAPDPDDPIALRRSGEAVWNDLEVRTDRLRHFMEASLLLHQMGKPTIAMVRGPAVGMGMALALACDFRIASETTFFATGFARIGMCGDFGISYFLTHLLGPSRAMELLMCGERVSAENALQMGLVNRLVSDAELESQTRDFALKFANGPGVALRCIKENVRAALESSIERAFDIEARNNVRCRLTEDCKEAVAALNEKRPAHYSGR